MYWGYRRVTDDHGLAQNKSPFQLHMRDIWELSELPELRRVPDNGLLGLPGEPTCSQG